MRGRAHQHHLAHPGPWPRATISRCTVPLSRAAAGGRILEPPPGAGARSREVRTVRAAPPSPGTASASGPSPPRRRAPRQAGTGSGPPSPAAPSLLSGRPPVALRASGTASGAPRRHGIGGARAGGASMARRAREGRARGSRLGGSRRRCGTAGPGRSLGHRRGVVRSPGSCREAARFAGAGDAAGRSASAESASDPSASCPRERALAGSAQATRRHQRRGVDGDGERQPARRPNHEAPPGETTRAPRASDAPRPPAPDGRARRRPGRRR